MSYARNTTVSADKSLDDIKRAVKRFGATDFLLGDNDEQVSIMFRYQGRVVRFTLRLPPMDDFVLTPSRNLPRSDTAARQARDAEVKRRHRSLYLCIKAKLVAIGDGIAEFDDEFLPYIVMPGGRTFAELVGPQIPAMIESGSAPKMPLLLSAGGSA